MASEPQPSASPAPGESRRVILSLTLIAASFLGYSFARAPRLDNYALGDVGAVAHVSAVAARLVDGARLYDEVAVPDAPGAPLVVSLIQRLAGGPRLLHEIWLGQLAELALGLVAFVFARRVAGPLSALFVFAASLVLLELPATRNPDTSLAALLAWGSLALGARALRLGEPAGAPRGGAALAAGACAAGALAFEQAIGLGSLLGWGGAFGYLRWVRRGDAVGAPRAPLAAFGVGALVGAACPLVLALIARGSLAGFAECAIGDWLALRDGPLAMAAGLTSYAIMQRGAFPSSLAATCLAVAIGWRVIRREGSLHVASSAAPRCSLRAATGAAALASLVFGVASALFATYARLPQGVISLGAALSLAPAFGFVFAVASFVMQLPRAAKSLAPEQRRAGASVNALILAALVESVFLPLSFSTLPEGRFGFAALTPLALTFLFLYAARTGWRWLPPVVFAVTGLGLFGPHLARLLDTDTRVSSGFWAGLAVNVRGRELLDAARRLDALAAPGDRVLVLPEDAELSLLFARRRPALRGGSVQVARYPARLVPADLAVLEASPPRFIVLYPRRTMLRKALFSLTPGGVGADAFADGATALVARRYRLVGRFRVTYVWDQDELAIFELNEGEREARP